MSYAEVDVKFHAFLNVVLGEGKWSHRHFGCSIPGRRVQAQYVRGIDCRHRAPLGLRCIHIPNHPWN